MRMRELRGQGMGDKFGHVVCLFWARSQFEEGGKPLLTVDEVPGVGNLGERPWNTRGGVSLCSVSLSHAGVQPTGAPSRRRGLW